MQDKPEKKTPRTLRLNARDNIIVAVDSVMPGVVAQGVPATERIMRGHKMATVRIAKGERAKIDEQPAVAIFCKAREAIDIGYADASCL